MKNFRALLAFVLVFTILAGVPAALAATERSSQFYSSVYADVDKLDSGVAEVSFTVTGLHRMKMIGVKEIKVCNSSGGALKHIYYTDSGYSNLMSSNKITYASKAKFTVPSGHEYYLVVYFYVKDSYGASTKPYTTGSFRA